MFWGALKAFARANCTYDFNALVQIVPRALASVSLSKIRKFARKSYRYMDACPIRGSNGDTLNPKQIEYAVKKYRQHRKIPLSILNSL
jgi:tRNA G37 N-methylase TrmD